MIKNKKISVIVPIYNAEKTLERCVDSILKQTHKEVEIILINDGSTDTSADICNKYSINFNNIKFINRPNSGAGITRNIGLDAVTGDYVCFLDSDDKLDERALEVLLQNALIYDADIVQAKTSKVYNESTIVEDSNIDEVKVLTRKEAMENYICCPKPLIRFAVWGKLFKKEILKELRFGARNNHEDVEFMARAIHNSVKLLYIPQNIYYTYVYKNSLSHKAYDRKKIRDLFEASDSIIALLKECQDYQGLEVIAGRARIISIMNVLRDIRVAKADDWQIIQTELKKELKIWGARYKFDDLRHRVLYHICLFSPWLYTFLYNRRLKK